jgi:hypothetical protein
MNNTRKTVYTELVRIRLIITELSIAYRSKYIIITSFLLLLVLINLIFD